jgi:phosphoribosyl-ATP pyrophosphohydrolase
MTTDTHTLDALYDLIRSRQGGDADTSYTAKLFAKGRLKIAQKCGEEAIETVIAATAQTPDALVSESADLLYHLLVLWAECGVHPQQVWDELNGRSGISGITEKNSRSSSSSSGQ